MQKMTRTCGPALVIAVAVLSLTQCTQNDMPLAPSVTEAERAMLIAAPMDNLLAHVADGPSEVVALVSDAQERQREFDRRFRMLLGDMLRDARRTAPQPSADRGSGRKEGPCDHARATMRRYAPRLQAMSQGIGVHVSLEELDEVVKATPACRGRTSMSVFGLPPALLVSAVQSDTFVFNSESELDAIVDGIVADSLTGAGAAAFETINLETASDLTAATQRIYGVSARGMGTIDAAVLAAGQSELMIAYDVAYTTDWVMQDGPVDPYLIFNVYFGPRMPTAAELWNFVGAPCTVNVAINHGSVIAAARLGARIGAVVGGVSTSGTGTVAGAVAGAAIGEPAPSPRVSALWRAQAAL